MKVMCATIFQNQYPLKRLPNESSIYGAEATAIVQAMNIITNHKYSKFIIHSDSKSIHQALRNENASTSLTTSLLDKVNTLSKNYSIILTWIPSRIYIHEHERADKTAQNHSWQTYTIEQFHTPT